MTFSFSFSCEAQQSENRKKPKKGLLISGWVFTFIGFLATIIFWLFGISVSGSTYGNRIPLGLGPWILLGLLPLLLGLILLLIYVVRSLSPASLQKDEGGKPVEGFGVVENNWQPDEQEIADDPDLEE